jgi:CRP/FNR family transcriptional regulator, cyclic AMP receptor protein
MSLKGSALALSRCELFKEFSETGLAILGGIAVERYVPDGTPLFVEGMASDAFFVVSSGAMRITVKRDSGEQLMGLLGIGDALGQVSLLRSTGVRMVSALADGDSEVVEIRSRDFGRLQAQKPQACLKLMMAVAGQFGRMLEDNQEAFKKAFISPRKA